MAAPPSSRIGDWRGPASSPSSTSRGFPPAKDADLRQENNSLWGVKASGGTAAPLTPDQGHFIMGCPAATLLSTGLTDEGERGELRQQESRLRGLDKDQPLSGEETGKK